MAHLPSCFPCQAIPFTGALAQALLLLGAPSSVDCWESSLLARGILPSFLWCTFCLYPCLFRNPRPRGALSCPLLRGAWILMEATQ